VVKADVGGEATRSKANGRTAPSCGGGVVEDSVVLCMCA